jgi:hypothetical protein
LCAGGGCQAAIAAVGGALTGLAVGLGLMKAKDYYDDQQAKTKGKLAQSEDVGNLTTSKQRSFGDLETIDAPGHNGPRPEIRDLTDEELRDSIVNPTPGTEITVRGNKVLDGNGWIKEARLRGLFEDDELINVDELDDEEEMAPWEKDDANDDKDAETSDKKESKSDSSSQSDLSKGKLE